MKIRNGFVSNSSSSSFILDADYFTTSTSVAYHMITNRGWPNDEELLGKLIDLVDIKEINGFSNLMFRSTNYDTYIVPNQKVEDKKCVLVSTCNNLDFNMPAKAQLKFPIYPDCHQIYESYGEDLTRIKEWKTFTVLESGFTGVHTDWDFLKEIEKLANSKNGYDDVHCKDCGYQSLWLTKQKTELVCPICKKVFWKRIDRTSSTWKKA